jgi:hypothetical protein
VQDTDWIKRNPVQHNHIIERLVLRGHEVRVIDYDITWPDDKPVEFFLGKRPSKYPGFPGGLPRGCQTGYSQITSAGLFFYVIYLFQ